MATLIKNIPMRPMQSSMIMGIDTNKKNMASTSTNTGFSTTNTKKWYRQTSDKVYSFDWDANMNELEFE